MKNKRKSILAIFIIFSAILGLSYYTNAAETLKTAQDKYRISYNNFMKALKEGADQDRIDQLSAQCKEDYAEYQKAVKGKNGSINKPNTPQTKPAGTIAPKVDSQSTNISIKQKIVTSQNNKIGKITKPSQPIQTKLARITDVNYGPGYISDLPPGFDDIKDETLKQRLKTIHDKASSWDLYLFCSNQYPNIPDLCGLARLYYIQAQIKNNSNYSGVVLGSQLAYLEQIKTFYENPKTKITEYIVAEIDKMLPKLKEYNDDKIKTANEQIKKTMVSYENYIKYITDKDGMFSPSNVEEMKGGINGACIKVNSAYWELGLMYSKIGDYKGLRALTDNYKTNFYNKILANYDVNCIQPDLSVKPVKVSLDYKESNQYFDLHDRCILAYLKHAETVDDGEEIFNKVTGPVAEGATETDNIDKLLQRMQTPFQGDADKNLVKEAKLSDSQINSYKEKMNIYKKKQVVETIYFTKYEDVKIRPSYESGDLPCSYEIPSPKDLICVRCQVVPNADSYDDGFTCFYPIKITIKSSISNRERTVIMKKTSFSGYCNQMQLNKTNDPSDKINNLIDIDIRQANPETIPSYPGENEPQPPATSIYPTIASKSLSQPILIVANKTVEKTNIRSISVGQCKEGGPGMLLKVPPSLYTDMAYFNKTLVRSYQFQLTEDIKNKVCPNSKEFLMSGGGEFVQAGKKEPNDEFIGMSKILVKRVANWFVIQGHGSDNPNDDSIGTEDDKVAISPSSPDLLMTANDENNNFVEVSKYSGMDVLIVNACFVFKHTRYQKWRKVLPKGLILGYHGEVNFMWMDNGLDRLFEALKEKPTMTQEEIGNKWKTINEDIVENIKSPVNLSKASWSYGYILPYMNTTNKNVYYSGKGYEYNEKDRKYIIIHNTEKIF